MTCPPRTTPAALLLGLRHLQVFSCPAHLITAPDMCSIVTAWRALFYGQALSSPFDHPRLGFSCPGLCCCYFTSTAD